MEIKQFIDLALQEDVGNGDHTTLACIPENARGQAKLLVKEPGVLAGVELAEQIFRFVEPECELEVLLSDGTEVKPGDIAFLLRAKVHTILKTERLMLNCMQRMSGIATVTHNITQLLSNTNTKVLDTRKTTPGMRMLEKWAVRIGGGVNHRIGLYDMIMLKDNHIDYAGGIPEAIESTFQYLSEKNLDLKVEVEARSMDELEQILANGRPHRVMLDNFTPEETRKAVALINGRMETESSGGITQDTIADYAACGVDFVSVGALTHSIKSLDLSFKAVN